MESEEAEFEVEDILRYRRNEDGSEYFLVKWIGYSESEATWEPLAHMNDNCRELIAKARALFAWRRPERTTPDSGEVIVSSAAASTAAQRIAPAPVQVTVEDDEAAPMEATAEEEVEEVEEEEEEEEEPPLEATVDEVNMAGPEEVPQSIQSPEGSPGLEPEINITIEDVDSPTYDEQPAVVNPVPKRPFEPPAPIPTSSPPVPSASSTAGSYVALKRARLDTPIQNGLAGTVPTPSMRVTPPAPPPVPVPAKPPKPPPSKEMKCLCGANEQLPPNSRNSNLVVCRICNCSLHPVCIENAIGGKAPADYVCPPCRLERVDEFHPTVGQGLLRHSYASCSSAFSLTFNAQAAQWKKQLWAVHLRAVLVSGNDLSGPAWPHKVQGKLNGRQCVAIDPPKHLHVRREQCYNLTPLLKPGVNTLEMKFFPKPDRSLNEPEERYCIGVVLTRPRSVQAIIARIRSRSQETVSSARARVERLLAEVAQTEAGQEDECAVTGNFGRILKPLCPVSHCPIEEAAIGITCNHVQVFDLQAYVAVNQRMRSLDKRWTCPVCSLPLRPDDVVLHPFAQGILDTLRGDEDLVDSIVFNEDCSWSTVSAIKNEGDRGQDEAGDGAGGGAELIDLSDSE